MSAAGSEGFRLLRLAASPGRALAELMVPAADSPLFAGHFPGHPVLPGVAHLALLQLVLGELSATTAGLAAASAIAEVRRLRLRRPVAPGDRLALHVAAAGAEGIVRFELRRPEAGGELVSQGTVRCCASGPPELENPRAAPRLDPTAAEGFPPPSSLLPHAAPALLLTAVLAMSAAGIACTAVIPAGHPLAAGGQVPGFVALELAAQAAAALQALLRQGGGSPLIGYLVGARDALFAPALPAGRGLRATAIHGGSAAPLATYEMDVCQEGAGGRRLATGSLSTFIVEGYEGYLEQA
jgi:3-hydroxyacyl-[acyl-carrier-protein] dehydratase